MESLLHDIQKCTICKDHLPNDPLPVVGASANSKILVVGQAPGRLVHESGIPWNDPSGKPPLGPCGIQDTLLHIQRTVFV